MAGPGSNDTGTRSQNTLRHNQGKYKFGGPVPPPPSPADASGFGASVAGLQQQYASAVGLYRQQLASAKANFLSAKQDARQQAKTGMSGAVSDALDRGVLGGSADLQGRAQVLTALGTAKEQALGQRQQDVAMSRLGLMQAQGTYYLGLAQAQAQKAATEASQSAQDFSQGTDPGSATGGGGTGGAGASGWNGPPPTGPTGAVNRMLAFAARQVGDPYVTGAENPRGPAGGPGAAVDCSGLAYLALNAAGVHAPRLTARGYQDMFGANIGRDQLRPGDLVFFWYPNSRGIPQGQASHVTIYIGNGQVISASGHATGTVKESVDWSAFLGGGRAARLYAGSNPWNHTPNHHNGGGGGGNNTKT